MPDSVGGGSNTGSETRTLRVQFSDACTDVLTFLADQAADHWFTLSGIADGAAPADADDALGSTCSALRTLRDCALVEARLVDGMGMWRATADGRATIAEARRDC